MASSDVGTADQRRAHLHAGIPQALAALGAGWQIEYVGDQAVTFTRRGRSPNHVVHLILSLLTMGLWLFVWLVVALQGPSPDERRTLAIDAQGRVAWGEDLRPPQPATIKLWGPDTPRWKRFVLVGLAAWVPLLFVGMLAWSELAPAWRAPRAPSASTTNYDLRRDGETLMLTLTGPQSLSGAELVLDDRWRCSLGTVIRGVPHAIRLERCTNSAGSRYPAKARVYKSYLHSTELVVPITKIWQ